ncbi:MAG: hypothetical protein QM778_18655 [Myxococcales bacterium]
MVGPAGGSVELSGIRLDVPSGSLAAETSITVTRHAATDLPAGIQQAFSIYGDVFEFEPAGLQFAVPATVTYSALPALPAGMSGTIFWSAGDPSTGFEPLLPLTTERLSANVSHFSWSFWGTPAGMAISAVGDVLSDLGSTAIAGGAAAVAKFCNDPILGGGHAVGDSCCLGLCASPLLKCVAGSCECNGCLNGGVCLPGNTNDNCGGGGVVTCEDCTADHGWCNDQRECECDASSGGCCAGGSWHAGTEVSACGSGEECSDCASQGLLCDKHDGLCKPCGPGTCDGCCDANGQCQLDGLSLTACGRAGTTCADCSQVDQQTCTEGYCQCPAGTRLLACPMNPKGSCVANDVGCCVAWRQTGQCSGAGPREPQNDLSCGSLVEAWRSGFCECASGVVLADCGHADTTCEAVCALAATF